MQELSRVEDSIRVKWDLEHWEVVAEFSVMGGKKWEEMRAQVENHDDSDHVASSAVAVEPPQPPGHRAYTAPTLSEAEAALVDEKLGFGGPGTDPREEILQDYMNIPISRESMWSLAPGEWLNDEVINFFFKMLEVREAHAVATSGVTDADGPRCYFMHTNFYRRLSEWRGCGHPENRS